MTMKKYLVAILLFSFSYAYAASGSGSIGTVNARGDLRVDGYTVQGNGTLFDGSAIETGKATATLRLENGTEITMDANSHGIVHRDHLVLLQGKGQLKASNTPFFLEADGLHVTPVGPNAQGVVNLQSASSLEVASINGEFKVADGDGLSVAHISSGAAMAFHQQTQAPLPPSANGTTVTVEGLVSFDDGHFYLTTVDGTKYELVGKDFTKDDGAKEEVTGTLRLPTTPNGIPVIDVSSKKINGAGFVFRKLWLTSLIIGGGAGAGIAIYEATKGSSSP
jgi:hypothetical protein